MAPIPNLRAPACNYAVCGGFSGPPPHAGFTYELPGVGRTVLLSQDAQAVLVEAIDTANPPFPATVYLAHKNRQRILWSAHFDNDIIAAKIDGGTLYIYNDKLGYWIDARTGQRELFTIDNYGGLSATDRPILAPRASTGRWYMETAPPPSSWNADGAVRPHHRVSSAAASNCYFDGATSTVTRLWK